MEREVRGTAVNHDCVLHFSWVLYAHFTYRLSVELPMSASSEFRPLTVEKLKQTFGTTQTCEHYLQTMGSIVHLMAALSLQQRLQHTKGLIKVTYIHIYSNIVSAITNKN